MAVEAELAASSPFVVGGDKATVSRQWMIAG
jgi:hypothetical protein